MARGTKTGGGSRKGSPNKRSVDGERYARALIDDPTVRATLLQQAQAGELPPALMQLFLAYAFGKPVDAACRRMASYPSAVCRAPGGLCHPK